MEDDDTVQYTKLILVKEGVSTPAVTLNTELGQLLFFIQFSSLRTKVELPLMLTYTKESPVLQLVGTSESVNHDLFKTITEPDPWRSKETGVLEATIASLKEKNIPELQALLHNTQ